MGRIDSAARGLLAALALFAVACAAPRRPNVVVLLVDTLRADHLPLYGYGRDTAPELVRRAEREGVVFERARAQAPCTFPSVNSILTSRSPGLFLARAAERQMGIPDEMPTLAGAFAAAGYDTAAVSASPIVRATPSVENPSGGFGAGFRRFDEFCRWREAACVGARTRQTLSELRPPYFLYVHYMDPHDPYRLPDNAGLALRFAGAGPPGEDRQFVRDGDPRPLEAYLFSGGEDPHVTDADLAHWVDLYDDEIRYWDREAAALVAELRQRDPETIVAVVADHGEEFLEHGAIKHCHTLFDTELHVPMVLLVPGGAPRRVALPVANLDLAPTLLGLAGLAAPAGFEGRDLTALVRGGEPPRRAADYHQFATFGRLWSVVADRRKLIAGGEPDERLFDLASDPHELSPLAAPDPERLESLRRALAVWQQLNLRAASEAGSRELEEQLRSVGYLQ